MLQLVCEKEMYERRHTCCTWFQDNPPPPTKQQNWQCDIYIYIYLCVYSYIYTNLCVYIYVYVYMIALSFSLHLLIPFLLPLPRTFEIMGPKAPKPHTELHKRVPKATKTSTNGVCWSILHGCCDIKMGFASPFLLQAHSLGH